MDAVYVRSDRPGEAATVPPPPAADTLAILLPGAYGTPADFLREGFASAVHQRSLPLDLALADAPVNLYSDGTVFDQLRDDLVRPARQRGYRHIWLAGISLGGLASLAYAARHAVTFDASGTVDASDIAAPDGVVVLAPYLGNRAVTGAIAAVGGVAGWMPPPMGDDDVEFQAWAWLRARATEARPLPLRLAYGTDDRFAAGHRLMADALPATDVLTLPGGHDWPTWRSLWDALLDQNAFALAGSPRSGAIAAAATATP